MPPGDPRARCGVGCSPPMKPWARMCHSKIIGSFPSSTHRRAEATTFAKDVTMRKKNILLLSAAAGLALGTLASAALSQTPGPFTQGQVDAGRQAFAGNCAACHQADLQGTNDAPQLAGSAFVGAWKG